jgi:cbb3-type cytochrome oxidase subunit 3
MALFGGAAFAFRRHRKQRADRALAAVFGENEIERSVEKMKRRGLDRHNAAPSQSC